MAIISVSVPEVILNEIEQIQKEYGFSGRSEIIREATRVLVNEYKKLDELSGIVNAVLILIHDHEGEHGVCEVKHRFEDITKTQIHNHLRNNKCLEIFVLEGDAKKIKEMTRLFQINKAMEFTKLVIA